MAIVCVFYLRMLCLLSLEVASLIYRPCLYVGISAHGVCEMRDTCRYGASEGCRWRNAKWSFEDAETSCGSGGDGK